MNKKWLSKLRRKWLVITYKDYISLKKKTNNFTNFFDCNAYDFNLLRVICNVSYKNLSRKVGFSYSWVTKILREENQISQNIKIKLSHFFKNLPKLNIQNNEFIVKTEKHYRRISSKLKDVSSIDNNIVKWFAILFSEGHIRDKGIVVVQKKYPQLLTEFIKISKEKFNIKFGKTWIDKNKVKRYEFYSYPFVEYLKSKFRLNSIHKPSIPNLILNLSKNKQRLFLKYFFHGDGNFCERGFIRVMQVNKKNIQVLSKILKNLNIIHHLYAWPRKKGRRKWIEYTIVVSAKSNLKNFLDQIGSLDKERFKRIDNYLKRNSLGGKIIVNQKSIEKDIEKSQPEVNIGLIGH